MRALLPAVLALSACTAAPAPETDFNLALAARDPAQAIFHVNRAIAADPRPEYLTLRARLLLASHQPDEALEDFTAAIDRTPADPLGSLPRARLLVTRAQLQGSTGRRAQAEADLSEAIRLVPGYTEAYLERAWLRRKAGRREEADLDVEEARKSGAGLADYFYNEAARAIAVHERAEADRMIEFALNLDPGHSRAHVARARLYMEQARFEEAAKELDRAIPVHPAQAELYYHRGTALMASGRPEPALKDFDTAAGLDPKEPIYLAARGMAKFRSGQDVGGARADFDAAIQADASCYAAWFNRGLVAYERKELEEAENALRRATAIHASPEGSIALGRVMLERGRVDQALDLLQRTLEIYPAPEAQKVLREEIERARRAKESKP